MERKFIIVISILVILSFFSGLFISKINFTGRAVQENEYSYTKAICSSGKCIDVLIYCKNNQVRKIEPISDLIEINASVNNSEKFCD